MLNTHWGKFGQDPDKAKMTYISDPEEYTETMTDSMINVTEVNKGQRSMFSYPTSLHDPRQ